LASGIIILTVPRDCSPEWPSFLEFVERQLDIPALWPSVSALTISSSVESQGSFTITSNRDWTIESSADWHIRVSYVTDPNAMQIFMMSSGNWLNDEYNLDLKMF
jgi:hypothetical protein